MNAAQPSPRERRTPLTQDQRSDVRTGRVRNLERAVDAALDAAALLRRTPDLELTELRRAGDAVSDLCGALADTCGHLAHELSIQDPEPTHRAHAAIEHLYTARDALNDAGDATRRTTSAAAALRPRPENLNPISGDST